MALVREISLMAINVKPGDRVIIEIRSLEVFEGNAEYVSPESIELRNIYCQTTDTQYEGNMSFYRDEVVSIAHIVDCLTNEASSCENEESFDVSKKIKLSSGEFMRLKEMTLQYIFIDVFDRKFKDAVEVLSNRESIGVVGLGNTFRRGKPLSLLVMSDFKQVYIFDLFCLVDLRNLKDILESEYIIKVVHEGTALFDCLYHKYGVEMKNIFDTQVVDTIRSKEEENIDIKRDISQCLAHHFNFPLALLAAAVDDINDKTWLERPVIKSNKIKAAQLVTYLLTLRDHLMKKILQEYNETTQRQYNKFKTISDM
ncbi:exonuclease 3'-5' domain-containing protein 1, partial [Asbolus verrucosus]